MKSKTILTVTLRLLVAVQTTIVLTTLSGCGNLFPVENTITKPTYPMDGVKLIDSAIAGGEDERTYLRSSYTLSPNARLLVRREDLADHESKMLIDADNKVTLTITLEDADQSALAMSSLKLCRITRNWMMLATWKKAHPFGKSGKWETEGADYDEPSCILPVVGASTAALVYDISDFVVERVRGHAGENFGFALIDMDADENIKIAGENAGVSAPSLNWTEVIQTGGWSSP